MFFVNEYDPTEAQRFVSLINSFQRIFSYRFTSFLILVFIHLFYDNSNYHMVK